MSTKQSPKRENLSRLADRPVLIKIATAARPARSLVCKIDLHRRRRVPEVVSRALILDKKGIGTFFGWMPVDLEYVTVSSVDTLTDALLTFSIRPLSYLELVTRLTLFSPLTMMRILRLLAVGNIRGFQFRIVRLLDSMIEPDYETWRKVHMSAPPGITTTTSLTNLQVFYSIIGNGAAAQKTRETMRGQTYPFLTEVAQPEEITGFTTRENGVWIRIPAGMEFDRDAVSRLIEPMERDERIVAVYCDEDHFDHKTRAMKPFFKPAFNRPLAASGWLDPDGAAIRISALTTDVDLTKDSAGNLLLAASQRGIIAHVPFPLLHRPEPRQMPKAVPPAISSNTHKVSVIIPTRDRADLMDRCLKGLFKKTSNADLDVIVIDNDSKEPETHALFAGYEAKGLIRRILMPGAFNFAKACNLGVGSAQNELILLLNNDVEPLHPEWLAHMAKEMEDNAVGACGSLLLFPDGYIQHGGVTLGAGSVARHSFHFRHPQGGEDHGLTSQRREVSAVTAACLLTRKSLWRSVEGMNEQELTVAFNDVDYCLKLLSQNKRVIWTPHARLTHLESVSRRADDTPEKAQRFAREEKYMHETWGPLLQNDPFYNPNLSLTGGDFVLDALPRETCYRTSDAKWILDRASLIPGVSNNDHGGN